jgi:hypothetical protein
VKRQKLTVDSLLCEAKLLQNFRWDAVLRRGAMQPHKSAIRNRYFCFLLDALNNTTSYYFTPFENAEDISWYRANSLTASFNLKNCFRSNVFLPVLN